MAEKVVVVHYSPLELFPPITNLLNILGSKLPGLHVFTTFEKGRKQLYDNPGIKIKRYKRPGNEFILIRLFQYFLFNTGVLYQLLRLKPEKILYYETYSAYPVYLYKRYFNRHVKIYFHSHEYFSPEWWKNVSMRLMQYYYAKEVEYLYPRASWISHTNSDRLNLFLRDIGLPDCKYGRVYPNYPPESWKPRKTREQKGDKLKLVYVGSFGSLDTLYVKEIVEWVKENQDKLELDIYSTNIPSHISEFIKNLECGSIAMKGEVNYDRLPQILPGYDVGLILYKGTTANFIYNAPNKLFEYLVCGLDVWYPLEMKGIHPYNSELKKPKVLQLNFTDLSGYKIEELLKVEGEERRPIDFTAENAGKELVSSLLA